MDALIIDNFDSFTFNLSQYCQILGVHTHTLRNTELSLEDISALSPDIIILSPGPGRPSGAGITLSVIDKFHCDIPILGVCLGHQAIGEYFGSRLSHSTRPLHGVQYPIEHKGHPIFKGISSPMKVARYHSLVLGSVLSPLTTIARTPEGEVMALAHNSLPIVGLQFHPESILTPSGHLLMENVLSYLSSYRVQNDQNDSF